MKHYPDLHKSLLTRTLSFHDVLTAVKEEEAFEITDTAVDDFVMFRYELNSIFKKNYFTGGD